MAFPWHVRSPQLFHCTWLFRRSSPLSTLKSGYPTLCALFPHYFSGRWIGYSFFPLRYFCWSVSREHATKKLMSSSIYLETYQAPHRPSARKDKISGNSFPAPAPSFRPREFSSLPLSSSLTPFFHDEAIRLKFLTFPVESISVIRLLLCISGRSAS